MAKKVTKKKSIKAWKKGINNKKQIAGTNTYPANERKGIRL